MKTTKLELLGWMIAAAIAGIAVASGFQGASSTSAIVDTEKVILGSDDWKSQTADIQKAGDARRDLFNFVYNNPVISVDQLVTLKTLWLKPSPTEVDKTELDKLKKDITDTCAKMLDLQKKQAKTPDEINVMDDYQKRVEHTQAQLQEMDRAFVSDIQQMRLTAENADRAKARTAAAAVAKQQAYTIVFDASAAPYGAHDITDATLLQMNKK